MLYPGNSVLFLNLIAKKWEFSFFYIPLRRLTGITNHRQTIFNRIFWFILILLRSVDASFFSFFSHFSQ